MRKYCKPELVLTLLLSEDVITTSSLLGEKAEGEVADPYNFIGAFGG